MREQIEYYNNLSEASCILSEQSGNPISTGLQGVSIWNMDKNGNPTADKTLSGHGEA
jgi:hypothetical protein